MTRARSTRVLSVRSAAVPMAAGSLCLVLASPVSATTLAGRATIAVPGTRPVVALSTGGSTTEFTVDLPADAACSGDTATDGYHVYSYLVPKGATVPGLKFVDTPSAGYGLVDTTGTYYGPVNTAIKTGQIVGVPNDFEWGPLVTGDGGSVSLSQLLHGPNNGLWEAGIVCATSNGRVSDQWNTQVRFSPSATDPHGFVWTAGPATAAGRGTAVTAPAAAATNGPAPTSATTPGTQAPSVTAGGLGPSDPSAGSLPPSATVKPSATISGGDTTVVASLIAVVLTILAAIAVVLRSARHTRPRPRS